jgi:hypothetical protein
MTRDSQTPTLGQVMNDAMTRRLAGVRTCIPARVLAYDEAKCAVDVQPVVDEVFEDETGERTTQPAPVISGVPLALYGSGGVRISIPVSVGDFVLLMFACADIDAWLALGGATQAPGTDRRFDLSDAVALPGVQPFANVRQATPQIKFTTAGTIELGGDQPLALKSDLDALKTIIAATVIQLGDGGAALKTAMGTWDPVGTLIIGGA